MNWKELRQLLAPTSRKIVLFLVLFAVFVPVVAHDNGILCNLATGGTCPSTSVGSILSYALGYHGYIYQFYYASILIGAVATYLIACLLVSLYRSVKR